MPKHANTLAPESREPLSREPLTQAPSSPSASSAASSIQVITMGCRLNTYESEAMRDHAEAQGLKDVVIINTCAVTNEAERSSRQAVRRAKKENPHAKIIVTGCSAQINPQTYQDMDDVDLVLGNHEKMQASSFDPALLQGTTEKVRVNNIMEMTETAHHLIAGFEGHSRAFIQIQNGCDHRCTFCTIPFGRGNNRSVPLDQIEAQVKQLLVAGTQEIVFTGVDITGYGSNLDGNPTLGQMTKLILDRCPDLKRLRLSSIDPVEVDTDLFDLIANEPRLMPHFHISLQAGDDMILKRMKRRHLRQNAIDFCATVRRLRPDVVFGADIIAGFPTETDQMFQNTYDLVTDCNLTYMHVFPYSARQGTPAARMPQVPMALRKERAAALRTLGQQQEQRFYESRVGTIASLLIEASGKGHTEHFAPVQLESGYTESLRGTIASIRITKATPRGLLATLV